MSSSDQQRTAEGLHERFRDAEDMRAQLERVAIVQGKLHEIEIADGTDEDRRRKTVLELLDRLLLALGTGDPLLFGPKFVSGLSAQIDLIDRNVSTYSCSESDDPVPALSEFTRNAFVPDASQAAAVLGGASEAAVRAVEGAQAKLRSSEELLEELQRGRSEATEALEALQRDAGERLSAEHVRQQEQLEKTLTQFGEELEADRTAFAKACEARDHDGDQLIEKLRQQLALSADYRLSAQYEHQAANEEAHADRMRRFAFGWGAAAAVVAVVSLVVTFIGAAQDWDVNQLALMPSKVTVVGALAALAGYSGSQSSRHRNAARQLRTTQLELANLGSYLEELTAEQRATVRQSLVPSFFGKTVVAHPDDGPTTVGVLAQQVNSVSPES